jgi:hypothetical protein
MTIIPHDEPDYSLHGFVKAGVSGLLTVGWFPLTVFSVHTVLAAVFNIYLYADWVDIPFHYVGGVAIAYFISGTLSSCSSHKIICRPDPVLHALCVIWASCSAAVVWELGERIMDGLFGWMLQVGLDDTLFDLFLGMLGAASFSTHYLIQAFRTKSLSVICEHTP